MQNAPQNYQQNEINRITMRLKAEINIVDYHDAYTIDTAMQAVAIIFSENKGFQRCTPESKYKAVLSMITQGLNPLKGQCSFAPYGDQLQLLRDYSGSIMVAKREDKRIAQINAKVVRDGDVFDFEIINGCYAIKRHQPTLQSLNGDIVAAYAVAVGKDGQVIDADIMTMEDIKKTWKNAQLKYKGEPVVRQDGTLHPGSNHGKYPEKMTCKTVVHRLCRSIIKSSSNERIAEAAELDEEYIVQESVQPQAPAVIDFLTKQEPQSDPPCNREQADQIVELSDALAQKDDMIKLVGLFVGREVGRLREITQIEAAQYIAHLEKQIKPEKPADDDMPDWA